METARLAPERVRARKSKMSSRRIRTHGQHVPPAESFKNLLLGIEVNLMKQIQQVNDQYYETSYHKRNVLLDALEDIGGTGLGFERQIARVVCQWRSVSGRGEVCETKPLTDLFSAQRSCRAAAETAAGAARNVAAIDDELREIEKETERYLRETERMQRQLNEQSDHFALARRLTRALAELQAAFAEMFENARKETEFEEVAGIAKENAELRRTLLEKQFQLEICSATTRRMQIQED
jgi:hypothetical protein